MNLINQLKNVKNGFQKLLKSDTGLYYIVRVFGLILSLIINLLLLQNISPSLYGSWTIVNIIIAIGVIIVSFGSRKLAYSFKILDNILLNKLISQILILALIFSVITYYFIYEIISFDIFLTTSFIVLFTALYQLVQVSIEKVSLSKFGIYDIFISIIAKSLLIYILSFNEGLKIYIFLIPILLTSFLRFSFFYKLSKLKYKFSSDIIPSIEQVKLLATNISDWTFANAFRLSLISTLPLLELGLVDRAFAFLKVPTNLVQETAQRVMYNKIGAKSSFKYILINALLIIIGSFSVIYFGYILGFWEGQWDSLTKYMLLVIPYVIIESIANLLIPFFEMTKSLVNIKTIFNFSATAIIFLFITLNVSFNSLLVTVSVLELIRLTTYLFLLKINK
tara:strand:+ start:9212 stop:10390 length:1179 start_codon:yes stop_codon:yes gene_type:complete